MIINPDRPIPNIRLFVKEAQGPAAPYSEACRIAYEHPKRAAKQIVIQYAVASLTTTSGISASRIVMTEFTKKVVVSVNCKSRYYKKKYAKSWTNSIGTLTATSKLNDGL